MCPQSKRAEVTVQRNRVRRGGEPPSGGLKALKNQSHSSSINITSLTGVQGRVFIYTGTRDGDRKSGHGLLVIFFTQTLKSSMK